MPPSMKVTATGSSPHLGLFNGGDNAYPTFVGRASTVFDWSALSTVGVRTLLNAAWKQLNYSGAAPSGFLPVSGLLYADYPTQLFRITEAVENFGSVSEAEAWMAVQRTDNAPNSNPATRNGDEVGLKVSRIGDDSFAYQITKAAGGDTLTDVIVRENDLLLGISIDAGPHAPGLETASSLVGKLLTKEQTTCVIT
jgi:hypothetical protein